MVLKPQKHNQKGPNAVCSTRLQTAALWKTKERKTLIMSTEDGTQLRKVTFPSGKRQQANVKKALGSVSKTVRNGNRVVFDTSGSYIETKDVL